MDQVQQSTVMDRDAKAASGAARARARVLVLDDHDLVRSTVVRVLRKHGYETHAAATGADALVLLQEFTFGLMYCDVNLEEESGIDLLPVIRTLAPAMPVVMLSGMNEASLAVDAMRAGALDYVTKPVATKQFLAITDRFTGDAQIGVGGRMPSDSRLPVAHSPLELQQALTTRRLVEIVDRLLAAERDRTSPAPAAVPAPVPARVPVAPTWDPPVPLGPVPIILVPPRPSPWRLRMNALLCRLMPGRFPSLQEPWAA
jgi:two-component system response regulator RegA